MRIIDYITSKQIVIYIKVTKQTGKSIFSSN